MFTFSHSTFYMMIWGSVWKKLGVYIYKYKYINICTYTNQPSIYLATVAPVKGWDRLSCKCAVSSWSWSVGRRKNAQGSNWLRPDCDDKRSRSEHLKKWACEMFLVCSGPKKDMQGLLIHVGSEGEAGLFQSHRRNTVAQLLPVLHSLLCMGLYSWLFRDVLEAYTILDSCF